MKALKRPDRFHVFAAASVNAVIEIHRGIAVRRDKLQVISKADFPGSVFEVQDPMFIAGPLPADTCSDRQPRDRMADP